MQNLAQNIEVWWSDPNNDKESNVYTVKEIKYDKDGGLYDETIIVISNGKTTREVEAWELQDINIRRTAIKKLVDNIIEIAEEDWWNVYNGDPGYNTVDLEFAKGTSAGQDFSFQIAIKSSSIDDFITAVDDYYESYDPDEEASLWIGPDGHGINGAPYRITDIIRDMEECEENIKQLLEQFNQKLKG